MHRRSLSLFVSQLSFRKATARIPSFPGRRTGVCPAASFRTVCSVISQVSITRISQVPSSGRKKVVMQGQLWAKYWRKPLSPTCPAQGRFPSRTPANCSFGNLATCRISLQRRIKGGTSSDARRVVSGVLDEGAAAALHVEGSRDAVGALLHDLLLKVPLERCAFLGRCHLPLKERGDLADAILIRLFIGGLCLRVLVCHLFREVPHVPGLGDLLVQGQLLQKVLRPLLRRARCVFVCLSSFPPCRRAAMQQSGIAVLLPQFACCCSFRQYSLPSPGCRDGIGLWDLFSPELGKCP